MCIAKMVKLSTFRDVDQGSGFPGELTLSQDVVCEVGKMWLLARLQMSSKGLLQK
jgi:hypothetical protein